ncbi:transposase, partial [Candidatus Cyanaurora vandensis]|uniref:transposase n=1 Tax=Candidatus Cyanaurora vandensis TaxID=2714958 RepID=UPI00257E3777
DYTKAEDMIATVPSNGVGVMDRGFASKPFIKKILEVQGDNKKYFVIRLNANYTLEALGNGEFRIGKRKDVVACRVINFCDLKNRAEYRLATNLPKWGEGGVKDEEIMEIYRKRWQIELLWKFLKMPMKLDRFISKNMNEIEMQIYVTLTCYLMLHLLEIPKMWGVKLLDKIRYL